MSTPISRVASHAIPSDPYRDRWEDFVADVLELTVAAYEALLADGVAQPGWIEEIFSAHMVRRMQHVADEHFRWIRVDAEAIVISDAVLQGRQLPRNMRRRDIQLQCRTWQCRDCREFVWEAKRVCHPDRESLALKYLKAGVLDRFVHAAYAAGVETAGMLGYVLCGCPADVVRTLNSKLSRPPKSISHLTVSDQLRPAVAVRSVPLTYSSDHWRPTVGRTVHLHHLFLTFGW